jgi:hypothetical protein
VHPVGAEEYVALDDAVRARGPDHDAVGLLLHLVHPRAAHERHARGLGGLPQPVVEPVAADQMVLRAVPGRLVVAVEVADLPALRVAEADPGERHPARITNHVAETDRPQGADAVGGEVQERAAAGLLGPTGLQDGGVHADLGECHSECRPGDAAAGNHSVHLAELLLS